MSSPASPIDSVLLFPEPEAPQNQWPAANFPPYTDQRLRDFVERLSIVAGDNLGSALSSLSEPGLYALVAAAARSTALELPPRITAQFGVVIPTLLTELRRRGCRGMGADPTGSVRRGRLLQIIGTFTTLNPAGTSPRERSKLAGACPFCAAEFSFQALLPQVSWQCSSCARDGALLEFAEGLLEHIPLNAA